MSATKARQIVLAAGFDKTDSVVPRLGKKRLRLVFG